MKFLHRESTLENAPDTSSPFALNMVAEDDGTVHNESGMLGVKTFNGENVLGVIETPKEAIIFHGEGKISRLTDTGIVIEVFNGGTAMRWQIANSIDGTYYYNLKGELIVIWWDGVHVTANTPKIMNLDCPPFPLNNNHQPVNPDDIRLLNLFLDFEFTSIQLNSILTGTGNLETGCYYFCFAYVYPDGSLGNFSPLSKGVILPKYGSNEAYWVVDGKNGNTKKSIQLALTDLDEVFDEYKLGIIYDNNGIRTAWKSKRNFKISKSNYPTISSLTQEFESALLEDLLIGTIAIDRVWTGKINNNRLYLSNFTVKELPKIQPYINNCKLQWKYDQPVNLTKTKGSYKDPHIVFDLKGYMPGEVYAFYLKTHWKNGAKTVHHIPGRAKETITVADQNGTIFTIAEDITVTDLQALGFIHIDLPLFVALNPNAKFFQVFETAQADKSLGFWENKTEFYSNTDCWQVLASDGTVLGDLRNKPVRHHRMPDLTFLSGIQPLFTPAITTNQAISVGLTPAGTTFDGDDDFTRLLSFTKNVINPLKGSFNSDNNIFTAHKNQNLGIKLGWNIQGIKDKLTINVNISRVNGVYETVYIDSVEGTNLNPKSWVESKTIDVVLNTGDHLEIFFKHNPDGLFHGFPNSITGTLSGGNIVQLFNAEAFENLDLKGYVLSVQISELSLPPTILDDIAYFELCYAKRTVENRCVISQGDFRNDYNGNSPGATLANNRLKTHTFDLLLNTPSAKMNYVKLFYRFNNSDGIDITNQTTVGADFVRIINRYEYLPNGLVGEFATTVNKEGALFLELNTPLLSLDYTKQWLGTIYALQDDVYINFDTQELIHTGRKILPASLPTPLIPAVCYDGDTFFNLFGYFYHKLRVSDDDEMGLFYSIIPLYSVNNIGLRKSELFHYPLNNLNPAEKQTNNDYDLNAAFNALNDFLALAIEKCEDGCSDAVFKYPVRTIRSVSNSEGRNFNFRKFLPNDYYDSVLNKGDIWKIEFLNDMMLIHHQHGLFKVLPNKHLSTNTKEAITIGNGDVFANDPIEILTDDDGYAGLNDKWGAIVFRGIYAFVDRLGGRVFLFDGSLREISNTGMKRFFRDLSKGHSSLTTDWPAVGTAIILGFDEKFNRLLLSKKVTNDVEVTSDSMTYSYSLSHERWVSEHSYKPNFYFNTRFGSFAINNINLHFTPLSSKIYRMNSGVKGMFFDVKYPSFFDIKLNGQTLFNLFKTVRWRNVSQELTSFNTLDTFDEIAIYTNHQSTGMIPLVAFDKMTTKLSNFRKVNNWFIFSNIRDNVLNVNGQVINDKGVLNLSNLGNKPFVNKKQFQGSFIVVRLLTNNTDNREITLITVETDNLPIQRL